MLKNRSIVILLFLVFTSFTSYPTSNVPVLKICFTGDLLLDRGVRDVITHKGADILFKGTDSLFKQMDYVVSNLECPVTPISSPLNKRFIFRAEPIWLSSLKKAGITHLCMANNHCNDQGRDGIIETYRNIRKFQMTSLGFCQNQKEGLSPVLIKQKGKTIALFNSALLPLENWMYLPDYPDIVMATAEKLSPAITLYKKKHPEDIVIVILHWGVEYSPRPTATQVYQARMLIDAGADAIIGHHPHVIQPISLYRGKPIAYSLGNFIFDSSRREANEGVMLEFRIGENIKIIRHTYEIRRCIPKLINKQMVN